MLLCDSVTLAVGTDGAFMMFGMNIITAVCYGGLKLHSLVMQKMTEVRSLADHALSHIRSQILSSYYRFTRYHNDIQTVTGTILTS